jgi:hypothetical protein
MGHRLYAGNADGSRLVNPHWGSDCISHIYDWATVVDFVIRILYDADDFVKRCVWYGNAVIVQEVSSCIKTTSAIIATKRLHLISPVYH